MTSFLSARHHCCWLFATASLDHLLSRQLLTGLTPSEACSGVCGFANHCYSDSMHHAEPRLARLRLNEERQVATPSLQTRNLATDPWCRRRSKFASSHQSSSHSWRQKACSKISDNHDCFKHTVSTTVVSKSLPRSSLDCHCHDTRGKLPVDRACDCISKIQKGCSASRWQSDPVSDATTPIHHFLITFISQ